ncbi:MAG: hypothetical protein KF700_10665 [Hyphomonadaceae bacterium]|nr:hypothetical protein [Hyphomonadaceae bacterium]
MTATAQVHVQAQHRPVGDERFFLIAAAVMVVLIIAGFLTLYLRGISTFAAPWPVHMHAVAFMAWVGFFMLQVTLATTGRVHLHKRLGWIGAILMPVLLILGAVILFRMMRNAAVPPFWTYAYFMTMNLMALVAFAALTIAAVQMRKKTQWHRRLMFCGMAALVVTPFNRLTPDAVLAQHMSLIPALAILLFPLAGMVADWLRDRRIHRAWLWGLGALIVTGATTEIAGRSPLAGWMVAQITAGSAGAQIDPFVQHLPPPL